MSSLRASQQLLRSVVRPSPSTSTARFVAATRGLKTSARSTVANQLINKRFASSDASNDGSIQPTSSAAGHGVIRYDVHHPASHREESDADVIA
ncbi:BQ5605_C004g02699 [Microbotryum silenes-dioicae]|uniref:BQ5605_C004g02699 protein n=1 Tax=Microbotryum silenes-dioicae TaxID=796604 RepID=A0A2X0MBU1_9BASI|nr:BQ5605_C004g02699 [Microbotryum silenes-dioicae]